MTLHELAQHLNPIIENKWTHYKSRRIHWSFRVEGWYNGEIAKTNVAIEYYSGEHRQGWKTVGFLEMLNEDAKAIFIHEQESFALFQELSESLPEGIRLESYTRS